MNRRSMFVCFVMMTLLLFPLKSCCCSSLHKLYLVLIISNDSRVENNSYWRSCDSQFEKQFEKRRTQCECTLNEMIVGLKAKWAKVNPPSTWLQETQFTFLFFRQLRFYSILYVLFPQKDAWEHPVNRRQTPNPVVEGKEYTLRLS